MYEGRDAAIKLFGRKIPLWEDPASAEDGHANDSAPVIELSEVGEKDTCKEKAITEAANPMMGSLKGLSPKGALTSSALSNSTDQDANKTSTETRKPEQADISGEDKLLKKPDKVLPCPRCNSMDTKFCYYNNYNVNQPRHFCKNCQRYWTAGGTMRNVPVGAGRRKNKHSASSPACRHTLVTPDGDGPDLLSHHQPLSCGSTALPLDGNGTILTFGPDAAPLCESMASILNLGEQQKASASGENREEPSTCSSSSTSSMPAENGFPEVTPLPHLQCFPGPPWAYPWNPGWNNAAAAVSCQENDISTQMSWARPTMLIAPAFCAVPFPLMAAAFWGCMPSWPCGPWSLPSSSPNNSSGNGSPTLGKHSRDASTLVGEEKMEKSLWIPKTLRIDDPNEAAKSSIFATLGIKPVECGKFKSFSSNTGRRDSFLETT